MLRPLVLQRRGGGEFGTRYERATREDDQAMAKKRSGEENRVGTGSSAAEGRRRRVDGKGKPNERGKSLKIGREGENRVREKKQTRRGSKEAG